MAVATGSAEGFRALLLLLVPFAWIAACLLGAMPALICAALFVWFDRKAPAHLQRPLIAVFMGASVMAALALTAALPSDSKGVVGYVAFLATVGGVTGGICAHLTRRWRYRRP